MTKYEAQCANCNRPCHCNKEQWADYRDSNLKLWGQTRVCSKCACPKCVKLNENI